MSVPANTQKVFNFRIEVDGIDEFYVQEVKHPEIEVGKVEHGADNYNVKTPGGVSVGDGELKMVKSVQGPSNWAWEWLHQAQNMMTGTSTPAFARDIVVKELNPQGSPVNIWLWEGAWACKISPTDSKRGNQNENMIDTVTISVNRVQKLM